MIRIWLVGLVAAWTATVWAGTSSFEGSLKLETRLFTQTPVDPAQARDTAAVVLNPTWKVRGDEDEVVQLIVSPYLRFDANDTASRYVDLREANLQYGGRDQVFRMGFDSVFWGVAESNHLVDVINQVDPRADVDMEAKLGQPMVSYSYFLGGSGRVEVIWLPYFRPRPGVGESSRQRLEPVPESQQTHGLGRFRRHDDWAVRWSGQIGDADLSGYVFHGLGREPDLSRSPEGEYLPTRQLGHTLQLPQGNMLWKLEAIRRWGQGKPFGAYVAGGEYTITQTLGEMGLLFEWSRDFRDDTAPPTRFARGAFGGVRYRFNESGDSEILAGALRDLRNDAWLLKAEFSRRLDEQIKLGLVARKVVAAAEGAYASLRRDGNLQVTLSWNF